MATQPVGEHHLNIMFKALQEIDIPKVMRLSAWPLCEKANAQLTFHSLGTVTSPWWSQTLVEVNDCVIRMACIHGVFHWHKHSEEDEFFLALEGVLFVDWKDEDGTEHTVELSQHKGFTVPKGVVHRTRADARTCILLVEKNTIEPTGDEFKK